MSALGTPVLINRNRAYWLSSIASDVIHSTIVVDELDANVARVSTLIADNIEASTVNVSSLRLETSDVSGMYVSSIAGNSAFFSTLSIASDLSGGLGYVRFSVDASGVQVDGDPIRFDNLVYLTSSINIVQVSTIVDTDIFAQRGFFSTLSSGSLQSGTAYLSSIICNDISGTNGSFDRLFVSSLEALDISGVAASNWSIYPTLNSSIIFQPGYVLSNIGNELFFAGARLTDVSGGGQNWSIFPAFSTVQMANNSMVGISTLQFQDGGRLTSATGNNLLYNGSNIAYGPAGNASNWAQYVANTNVNINNNNLSNALLFSGSNLALTGSNITNGNTFTNSLGVGGLSLVPLASITSGGDIFCRNLDVGDSTTALGDLNVYGSTAAPGDNALYVLGGTTLTGGLTAGVPVHGTEIGALPVAGIDTVRIDVLPAGMGLNSATYIQLAAAGAGSFAAGGALSLAGGDYIEMNTDDLRVINTTSGNQSTTLTVANIQMPGSVASTVPLQINNTAGGGINLVGTPGVGQIAGFSTILGDVLLANNNIISPNMSTLNINLSTINGQPFTGGGGGASTLSSFVTAEASTFQVSTLRGFPNFGAFTGSTINVETGLQFVGQAGAQPNTGRWISSLREINDLGQNLNVFVSTMFMSYATGTNSNGFIRVGGGAFNDTIFREINQIPGISTAVLVANSSISQELTLSSLKGFGGLPIKVANTLEFVGVNALNNVDVINLNPPNVPILAIGASTITLDTNNVRMGSVSTIQLSTSAFNFSTATCVGSNTAFNYPLFIEFDHAGATTAAAGAAILVQGHNLGTGAVRNTVELGVRANGECFIATSWPGQNLEDFYIDATDLTVRDGTFSTIINLDPYGLITSGAISAPQLLVSSIEGINLSTQELLVSSINSLPAQPAFTNNLMLSTMELYAASTTLMYWDSTTTSSNINSSGYDAVVGVNGAYKIGASFQFLSGGTTDEVEFFILKNNNVISQSGGIIELQNNAELVTYVESIESLVNGDAIQIGCYTANANVFVSTINGAIIQSPACILTMYRVDTV